MLGPPLYCLLMVLSTNPTKSTLTQSAAGQVGSSKMFCAEDGRALWIGELCDWLGYRWLLHAVGEDQERHEVYYYI